MPSLESLLLLKTLEEYLPYMNGTDLKYILGLGYIPGSVTILGWELQRQTARKTAEKPQVKNEAGKAQGV